MAVSAALRSAIGVLLHAGNAALAAATALSSCALEARGACANASAVAGLITSIAASPSSSLPSISILNSLIALLRSLAFRGGSVPSSSLSEVTLGEGSANGIPHGRCGRGLPALRHRGIRPAGGHGPRLPGELVFLASSDDAGRRSRLHRLRH